MPSPTPAIHASVVALLVMTGCGGPYDALRVQKPVTARQGIAQLHRAFHEATPVAGNGPSPAHLAHPPGTIVGGGSRRWSGSASRAENHSATIGMATRRTW